MRERGRGLVNTIKNKAGSCQRTENDINYLLKTAPEAAAWEENPTKKKNRIARGGVRKREGKSIGELSLTTPVHGRKIDNREESR